MQKELQDKYKDKYKDKWEPIGPESGKNKLLWMIGGCSYVLQRCIAMLWNLSG